MKYLVLSIGLTLWCFLYYVSKDLIFLLTLIMLIIVGLKND